MQTLAANPRAVALGGAPWPRKAPLALHPPPAILRPAWVVLAQFEHGPLIATVCTDAEAWGETQRREFGDVFAGFAKYKVASVSAGAEAIDLLAADMAREYGSAAAPLGGRLAQMMRGEWTVAHAPLENRLAQVAA